MLSYYSPDLKIWSLEPSTAPGSFSHDWVTYLFEEYGLSGKRSVYGDQRSRVPRQCIIYERDGKHYVEFPFATHSLSVNYHKHKLGYPRETLYLTHCCETYDLKESFSSLAKEGYRVLSNQHFVNFYFMEQILSEIKDLASPSARKAAEIGVLFNNLPDDPKKSTAKISKNFRTLCDHYLGTKKGTRSIKSLSANAEVIYDSCINVLHTLSEEEAVILKSHSSFLISSIRKVVDRIEQFYQLSTWMESTAKNFLLSPTQKTLNDSWGALASIVEAKLGDSSIKISFDKEQSIANLSTLPRQAVVVFDDNHKIIINDNIGVDCSSSLSLFNKVDRTIEEMTEKIIEGKPLAVEELKGLTRTLSNTTILKDKITTIITKTNSEIEVILSQLIAR